MAEDNFFAQFDTQRDTPMPPQQGTDWSNVPRNAQGHPIITVTPRSYSDEPNFFEQFEPLREKNYEAPKSSFGSIAQQFPVGFNEALADTLGLPADVVAGALNLAFKGINKGARAAGLTDDRTQVLSEIKKPFGGSESLKDALGVIGADPRAVPANTAAEKIARGAGGGVAAMLVPEAAVGAAARAGVLAPEAAATASRIVGASKTPGDAATSAAVGAAGGATGEGAAEVVPDEYKPVARVGGALVGGGAAALTAETPHAVGQGIRGAREFAKPLSVEGREELAGGTLASRAENVGDVKAALDNAPREIVPGSRPTTFQVTGDMGLGALEREQQTKHPQAFMQRRAEQNEARVEALRGVQPEGNPAEVANAVRRSLQDIDAMTAGAVDRATQRAQGANQELGGHGSPEGYGATLRGAAQDAENAARERERTLWSAVDADGTLTVTAEPVRSALQRVYGNMTRAGESGLTGAERTLQDVIGGYGRVVPFRELADLRSRLSTDMRQELATAGRSPAYARLSQLRGAVEDGLHAAVEQKATQEAEAIARGELSPEQTIAAAVQRQVDAWRAKKEAGGASAQSVANAGTSRATSLRPGSGSQSAGRGRSADVEGDSGLQENGRATFDEAARGRLEAANQATRERIATYGKPSGPVGEILRSQGERGQYRVPDAAVGQKIFTPGPRGFENVQAYRRATSDPEALNTLQDYVASRLKQVASRPDGTLDLTKTENWLRAHSEAMRAFPELGRRFRDATSITDAIEDVAAIRKQAMADAQAGALGKLIGAHDAADVTKIVGGIFSGSAPIQAMRRVVGEANRNPEAMQGLRKAVVDYMYGRFISNTEAATSGTGSMRSDSFQTFVRQNRGVLRQVLSEAEVNTLSAIGEDLQRTARSLNAVRIPGQSNTAQDIVHELEGKTGSHGSLLSQIILAGGGGFAAHGFSGAFTGIAGVLGKNMLSSMREAGMKKFGDLVKEAMLNPELARRLLAKAPQKATPRLSAGIVGQLRKLSMFVPVQAQMQDNQ
jgi:hypothetical protein